MGRAGGTSRRQDLIISLRRAGHAALPGATSVTSKCGAASERKRRSMGSLRNDAATSTAGVCAGAGGGSETMQSVETSGSTRSSS